MNRSHFKESREQLGSFLGVHDESCLRLYRRLVQKDCYDRVYLHFFYSRHDLRGEMDVLAIKGGWAHYYEVKTTDTTKAYSRARAQFLRGFLAFPEFNWQFPYLPSNNVGVRRYRPDVFGQRKRRTGNPGLIECVRDLSIVSWEMRHDARR